MKPILIVLTSVTLLSGIVLAVANTAFAERIEANRKAAFERSLAQVFSGSDSATFERLAVDATSVHMATAEDGVVLGYAVAVDTPGYGGTIRLLVGVGPDLTTIMGLAVVENIETPGLGARIEEEWFRRQFEGLDARREITYVKNRAPAPGTNGIEAISGATISTRAVVSGINNTLDDAIEAIRKLGASREAAQ